MKYSGAISYAVALAAVAFVGVNVFGWTFFTSCVVAFVILLGYLIVTRVKIIRVNQPISSDIKFSDLTSLMLPRYFWHGLEGQFYTTTLNEGEAILNRMKDIDRDSWVATDLFEGMDKE